LGIAGGGKEHDTADADEEEADAELGAAHRGRRTGILEYWNTGV